MDVIYRSQKEKFNNMLPVKINKIINQTKYNCTFVKLSVLSKINVQAISEIDDVNLKKSIRTSKLKII